MGNPSENFLIVARYAILELPFEKYIKQDRSVKKIPKRLLYRAIDLWLYDEEYVVSKDRISLKILKSALKSEQGSRFAEVLKKSKTKKKRGRKSKYDKELVGEFLEKDYESRLKDWNEKPDKENHSKPNLAISFDRLEKILETEHGIKDIKKKSLRKVYERYCSTKVPYWFKCL